MCFVGLGDWMVRNKMLLSLMSKWLELWCAAWWTTLVGLNCFNRELLCRWPNCLYCTELIILQDCLNMWFGTIRCWPEKPLVGSQCVDWPVRNCVLLSWMTEWLEIMWAYVLLAWFSKRLETTCCWPGCLISWKLWVVNPGCLKV